MLKRTDPLLSSALRDVGRRWSVNRISMVVGALGLAFMVAATGFIGWKEHDTMVREAREHARASAFFLADHAARLFEVSDFALRSATVMIGTDDWHESPASQEQWTRLRSARSALPYVEELRFVDPAGQVKITTAAFPAPAIDMSGLELFRTLSEGSTDFAISDASAKTAGETPKLMIGRRLAGPDGLFRGIVAASIDLGYFAAYWNRVDIAGQDRIAMVREGSGAILTEHLSKGQGAPWTSFEPLARVAPLPETGSSVTAGNQVAYYHRVGALPLYLVVSFADASVAAEWRAWFWRFIPFPLAAVLALSVAMVLGVRQNGIEARAREVVEAARAELSVANQQLEARVAARTLELKENAAEVQRFAYIVSHDLRAPLVNIMGFTSELEGLRSELFGPDPSKATQDGVASLRAQQLWEEFDEALGFIKTSIDKMDRLIKAILLLSRQGQRAFVTEHIDMNSLMRSIVDGFAHRTQSTGASITVGPLPPLSADRTAVEQIFSNLIDNAVKYLRPDTTGRIEITGSVLARKATYMVRDNGRGIDPKDHARVFDLFRRSGPQDQAGEGIGLAHVRSLVRRLGGGITLESTLGSGSTFTVVLPLDGGGDTE